MDLYKLSFKLVLWLFIAVERLNSQDCKYPIKPIYGGYHVEDNQVTYYCRKGYGLLGDTTRHCINGRWDSTSPVCVKAIYAVMSDGHLLNNLTDNDETTCIFVQKELFKLLSSSKISFKFRFDNTFSSAIIRVTMTSFLLGSQRPIFINGKSCYNILKVKHLIKGIDVYDFNCSLVNIKSNILEIGIKRHIRSSLCEIQIIPNKRTACLLSELSEVNVSITFDPEVFGKTAFYGNAAIFRCSGNTILRGSEVRYCIEGNQWSGNQTFCEEVRVGSSKVTKYFPVIISSSIAAGLILIAIIILTCIILRRKRAKPTSPQDIQFCEVGPSRISVIDHYYTTMDYDCTENDIRDSEDYDYCSVNETATAEASTNWKFAQFTIRNPRSPVSLIDNEVYLGD